MKNAREFFMKTTMKALNLHAIDDLRLDTLPMPEVGEDEVLVKIAYCGVCGSDIPRVYSKGTYHFPTVIGHEFSGVVEYDPEGEFQGKRVAVFPLLPCFACDSCRQERYALCADYDYYGSRRDGAFAEYLCIPETNVILIDESLDEDVVAFFARLYVWLVAVASVMSMPLMVIFNTLLQEWGMQQGIPRELVSPVMPIIMSISIVSLVVALVVGVHIRKMMRLQPADIIAKE